MGSKTSSIRQHFLMEWNKCIFNPNFSWPQGLVTSGTLFFQQESPMEGLISTCKNSLNSRSVTMRKPRLAYKWIASWRKSTEATSSQQSAMGNANKKDLELPVWSRNFLWKRTWGCHLWVQKELLGKHRKIQQFNVSQNSQLSLQGG